MAVKWDFLSNMFSWTLYTLDTPCLAGWRPVHTQWSSLQLFLLVHLWQLRAEYSSPPAKDHADRDVQNKGPHYCNSFLQLQLQLQSCNMHTSQKRQQTFIETPGWMSCINVSCLCQIFATRELTHWKPLQPNGPEQEVMQQIWHYIIQHWWSLSVNFPLSVLLQGGNLITWSWDYWYKVICMCKTRCAKVVQEDCLMPYAERTSENASISCWFTHPMWHRTKLKSWHFGMLSPIHWVEFLVWCLCCGQVWNFRTKACRWILNPAQTFKNNKSTSTLSMFLKSTHECIGWGGVLIMSFQWTYLVALLWDLAFFDQTGRQRAMLGSVEYWALVILN